MPVFLLHSMKLLFTKPIPPNPAPSKIIPIISETLYIYLIGFHLNEKLNTETARISWEELQPHFARGAAVYVAPDLDLIAVARHVAEDEAAPLKQWMEQGKFGAVSDDMARTFLADNQEMWAVVVAPWVLVQPCKD